MPDKVQLSVSRRSLSDLVWVWGGTLASAAAGMLTQLIIARVLQPESFGVFSSALGLAALATPLIVFGISQYWLKVFGEEGWLATKWLRPGLSFLMVSGLAAMLILGGWAFLGPNDAVTRFVILALMFSALSMAFKELVGTKFQLEQRYIAFSIVNLLTPALRFAVALAALAGLTFGDELRSLAVGYVLVALLVFIIVFPQLQRLWHGNIDLKGHGDKTGFSGAHKGSLAVLLSESWIFGLAGVLYLAWAQAHVVYAKYFLGDEAAGLYGAALIILTTICLLPTSLFSKFLLPKIHRWASQDFVKLREFSRLSSLVMFLIGIVAAVAIFLVSDFLIALAFGEAYAGAALLLKILACTLPMRFLGYTAGAMLRTKSYMQIKVAILCAAAIFNLLLAFWLVGIWGLPGLAATVAITEFVLVLGFVLVAKFSYFKKPCGAAEHAPPKQMRTEK